MDEFMLRAVLAGGGVALLTGGLGCFIVWQRMAYFSDSLAHSALLGLAVGALLGLGETSSDVLGVALVATGFALILAWSQENKMLTSDTMLGVLAHSALALGMIFISFTGKIFNLHAYLFGDILLVQWQDIAWIYGCAALVITVLVRIWSQLVAVTIHPELAQAEGVRVLRLNCVLFVLMAFAVAVMVQVTGVLLVTSMLIIPAAAVQFWARKPESMAVLATLAGFLSILGGLWGSLQWDLPSGPAIIVTAMVLLVVSIAANRGRP